MANKWAEKPKYSSEENYTLERSHEHGAYSKYEAGLGSMSGSILPVEPGSCMRNTYAISSPEVHVNRRMAMVHIS
jgi:hypothetical protein